MEKDGVLENAAMFLVHLGSHRPWHPPLGSRPGMPLTAVKEHGNFVCGNRQSNHIRDFLEAEKCDMFFFGKRMGVLIQSISLAVV